jgi:hypothetical protein
MVLLCSLYRTVFRAAEGFPGWQIGQAMLTGLAQRYGMIKTGEAEQHS